jgi:hypothetical protein
VHDVAQRPTIAHKRRMLSCFQYQPPLIRFNQDAKSFAIGEFSTRPRFDLMADDFRAAQSIGQPPLSRRR